MKNLILAAFAVCMLAAAPAFADEYAPKGKGMPDEAAMQKMMEATMPGAAHKVLDGLVGNWNYIVTFKMAPDAPEQSSAGKSENKWVLDGRFIEQKVSGTMDMNGEIKPFNGIGYIGHDNVKGEYMSTWMDNMTTGLMTAHGKYDTATKTLKESGSHFCPMRGAEVQFESELHFADANHVTYTVYDVTGERYKSMEIKYTRQQ